MTRWRNICAVASVAAVGTLGACSSGTSDAVDSSDTVAPMVSTVEDSQGDEDNDISEQKKRCSDSLAGFSAVSNMLMSGLSRPTTFDIDAYEMQLDRAAEAAAAATDTTLQADFDAFINGYRAAGEAVEASRDAGGTGTVQGANEMDVASAVLNDVAVTMAAENVAEFLANGC